MCYLIGLSCEDYPQYGNIDFCQGDLFLLSETLIGYCDYCRENSEIQMVYLDSDESCPKYWYEKLEEISKVSTSEDTILFYFAGHGMIGEDDAFFVLPNTIRGQEKDTGLSLAKINSILKEAKCSTFSIIDACHSGEDERGLYAFGFDAEVMDKSWATLAACSKNEHSYPDKRLEQGIFTYYIAETIKDWDKENYN